MALSNEIDFFEIFLIFYDVCVALKNAGVHVDHHFVDKVTFDTFKVGLKVLEKIAKHPLDKLCLHPWSDTLVKVPILGDNSVAELEAFHQRLMQVTDHQRVHIVTFLALFNPKQPSIRIIKLTLCIDSIVEVLVEG